MSITVNTNMQALKIQQNLTSATDQMNTAMERMSSGSKINSAKDDAAGLAVSTKLTSAISGSKIASDNANIGSNLLDTAEGTLNVITDNLQRISDLVTEASNGTYSSSDLTAISQEVTARVAEIKSLASSCTFNSVGLFGDTSGAATNGVTLQVGTNAGDTINLSSTIFQAVDSGQLTGLDSLASTIAGGSTSAISGLLTSVSSMISNITTRETKIGAAQNQLEAVSNGLTVQQTNLTAARSTIKDADVAQESASYVASQILQSASATLLVQANSSPQIALTLIKG